MRKKENEGERKDNEGMNLYTKTFSFLAQNTPVLKERWNS